MVTEKYNHAFIENGKSEDQSNANFIQLGDDSTGLRMEVEV